MYCCIVHATAHNSPVKNTICSLYMLFVYTLNKRDTAYSFVSFNGAGVCISQHGLMPKQQNRSIIFGALFRMDGIVRVTHKSVALIWHFPKPLQITVKNCFMVRQHCGLVKFRLRNDLVRVRKSSLAKPPIFTNKHDSSIYILMRVVFIFSSHCEHQNVKLFL